MTSHLTEPAIAAAGMRKSYGDKIVLDGVDLRVLEGTIFALLGPNGAGTTTIVHILSTLSTARMAAIYGSLGMTSSARRRR